MNRQNATKRLSAEETEDTKNTERDSCFLFLRK